MNNIITLNQKGKTRTNLSNNILVEYDMNMKMKIMYKYCTLVSKFIYIAVRVSNSETTFIVHQD